MKFAKLKWAIRYGLTWAVLVAVGLVVYNWLHVTHTPTTVNPHDNGLGGLFPPVFSTVVTTVAALGLLVWIPIKFSLFALISSALAKVIFRSVPYGVLFSLAVYAGTPWVIGSLLFQFWLLLAVSALLYAISLGFLHSISHEH